MIAELNSQSYSGFVFLIRREKFPLDDFWVAVSHISNKKALFINDTPDRRSKLSAAKIKVVDFDRNENSYINLISVFVSDIVYGRRGMNNKSAYELAERIIKVSESLSATRINSLSGIVAELNSIADKINIKSISSSKVIYKNNIDARHETKNTLIIIAGLLDVIDNKKLAAIITAGAVSALVGYVGWSAVLCNAVCLASWHGKDVLIEAIRKLPSTLKK